MRIQASRIHPVTVKNEALKVASSSDGGEWVQCSCWCLDIEQEAHRK